MAPFETPVPRPPPWQVEPRREVRLGDGRSVVLRPLVPADENLVAEFFATLGERESYYFYPLDEAAARRLAREVEQDPAYRLVAMGEWDGQLRLLGYTYLHWHDAGPPTFGICLRDGIQSAGLGRLMLEHLLTSAAASGIRHARLSVHPDNWRALRLYQRAGFRIVDEFVNQHQRVKQYRMRVDLLAPRPSVDDDLTIVPVGGIGVGLAAARLQEGLAARRGRLPLILDRPARPTAQVIYVTDLGSLDRFPPIEPHLPASEDLAWQVTLDARHLLLAGSGLPALQRAVAAYLG